MAYDGIEVEIKIKTTKTLADVIKKKLLKGEFTQIHHIDTYFDNKTDSFLKKTPIKEWLSVRNRGDKVIINHKSYHFNKAGISTYCDEVDLVVNDNDNAVTLLTSLGFEPVITVNKKRTEGLVNESFLVSVDEVAELGYFVEIEATKQAGSIEKTIESLNNIATELGLNPSNVGHKGYPHLLLEKRLGHDLSR